MPKCVNGERAPVRDSAVMKEYGCSRGNASNTCEINAGEMDVGCWRAT
jgi:hypothetical protein